MNRAMILPAAIAAGLHVAVLGFRSAPQPETGPSDDPPESNDTWIMPIIPDEPPIVDPAQNAEPPQLPPPSSLMPQGAELPTIESFADFQIMRPSAPETHIPNIDRIDPNWRPNDGREGGPNSPWVLMTELDNEPRALFRSSPTRSPGTGTDQETVTVDFVVGKDGNVAQARVIDSSNPSLEDPCLRAVKRWRFEPGMRKNRPLAFRMQQTFVFKTND